MVWFKSKRRAIDVARTLSAVVASGSVEILDAYTPLAPSPKNAIEIFAGQWASKFPPPFDNLTNGAARLFEDSRVEWAISKVGGVAKKRILELGPLEGGHTFMLDRAGAAEVLAIESNTRAYLKCLVAKELLGMPSARFTCGNFEVYLDQTSDRFDLVFASGVLYHMVKPVELIAKIAAITDAVFLWTHFYDERFLSANPRTAHRIVDPTPSEFQGYRHELHRHEYGAALASPGFCGGSRPHAYWMTRQGILDALRHFGFSSIETSHEQPDHPNGPAFSVMARR
jgi:Protein of unknown function (DUF1698)